MKTLEDLSAEWMVAKQEERMANAKRVNIENEILEVMKPNKDGRTTRKLDNGFSIVATAKTNFKTDLSALEVIVSDWDQVLVPLKTKIELDESKLKALRESHPKLWLEIATVIESKPAKTHIAVEV